ncbi:uncharacterized protein LOC131614294 [Vicia villosa]|uniref:uncharacterized protein LOC131614294 n=1 Tax=Vicia villosa TaxID=3911 RepID=UPI00273B49A0|nr:uncharacterized protein LOC131614294 [Vicia villosa]
MDCTPAQKVRYGTHMLAKEADDWWLETLARLEASGDKINWNMFRREFLRKYYPEDVRGKKEIEFLELTQGDKSVTEYAAKFTELIKFYPHFDGEGAEFSKCIKFQNGLCSEIKKVVGILGMASMGNLKADIVPEEEETLGGIDLKEVTRGFAFPALPLTNP